ncbi:50S ribosomal protein L6 [Candidatus Pacearchaeota archaeon]|nr:50S ribosomal protein L6 [Candidatus Pacearchaeota archaeon]|tara:strand:+ start:3560 stop:4111 length:552 start_codon:yes stop_codon:yes gene_type:complete
MTKKAFLESLDIPEGIPCSYEDFIIVCKKDSLEIKKEVKIPNVTLKIADNKITFESKKGSKNEIKKIKTVIAHLKNIFSGLNEPFVYRLESANVHFPMTLKVEGSKLVINNFLGEKVPRTAEILPNVNVEIKGQEITITGYNKESAGQTAANFENATKVVNKDRRIFQDGIYITEKPGDKKHG